MLGPLRSRAAARAITAALAIGVTFAALDSAVAKPKAKKARAASPSIGGTGPALRSLETERPRFFTIDGVLAKEGRRGPTRLAAVDPASATDASPAVRLPEKRDEEPFGLFAFRAPEGQLWHKWRGIAATLQLESRALEACRIGAETCARPAARFLAIVKEAAGRSGRARLEYVNGAFNAAIQYTADYAQHGIADRWSAPLEALASGRGDCEDYAIAKYVALREAGVSANHLRIVLLRDTASREDHAVLTARDGGRWYVLDNRGARFAVDQDLPHYMPLFGLNHDGVTLFAAPYAWNLRGSLIEPATADGLAAEPAGEEPLELRGSIAAGPAAMPELPPVQPLL